MLISVGNVNSEIIECDRDEYLVFRECLTIDNPNKIFIKAFQDGIWDGQHRFFKNKTFPTGLLHLVLKAIPSTKLRERKYPKHPPVDPYILRDKQMVGKYAYQAVAVNAMLEHRRGIVFNATGSGKTVTAAAFIQVLQKPTLFLLHQKELAKQTIESFKDSLTLPVGMFGSGNDDRQLVTVGMVPTIARRLKDSKVLDWLATIEVVIQDEVHLASAKTFTKVLEACTNANYRIGLSGTPLDRSELDNIKVKAQIGDIITEVRSKDLIDINVLSKPAIRMIPINIPIIKGTYQEVYTQGIVENVKRNRKIVSVTRKLLKDNHTVLILVKRVNHGEILQKMLSGVGIVTAFCKGTSTEEERDSELSSIRNGKSKILILSKIGQTGLDIKSLTAGYYAGGGKSTVEVIQSLGRYLRITDDGINKVIMYDFYDKDGSYLEEHSEKRKEIYEREKFEVRMVEY